MVSLPRINVSWSLWASAGMYKVFIRPSISLASTALIYSLATFSGELLDEQAISRAAVSSMNKPLRSICMINPLSEEHTDRKYSCSHLRLERIDRTFLALG